MKHIKVFETFKEDFEKHRIEKNAEVNKITNFYFHKEKEIVNSYIVLINEAGQELIDDFNAVSSYDRTLGEFLFKIEVGRVSKREADFIFSKLQKFEKKLNSEFQIKYRTVVDLGYDVHKRGTFEDVVDTKLDMISKRAKKTLIQVWLS